MTDISKERRREMTREQREAMRWAVKDTPSFQTIVVDHWTETKLRIDELRALLDAADERDRLRAEVAAFRRVKAQIRAQWEADIDDGC